MKSEYRYTISYEKVVFIWRWAVCVKYAPDLKEGVRSKECKTSHKQFLYRLYVAVITF